MTEHWPDKPKRKPKLKRKRKLKDRPGWHWWLLPLLFLLLILLVGVSLFVTVERESGEESGEIEPVTVGDCAPPETPLVFRRYVDQQVDLYVMGGPDSQPRQLTDSENLEHFADWSPDGQYIAFRTNEALVLIDADGTNQRVLFEKPAEAEFNTIWWSPDSHYVGFVVGNSIAQWWKLYTVHSASGTVTELDTHTYTNPIWWWWSPDGSRIVYAAQQDGITGVYAIAPDSAPDGDQQITFNADTGEEPRANWSPDGQMVAYYNANARQIEIVAAGSGDMLHRIDGGWNIFGSGGPHRPWSPD
ncbi:MAG: PD40 domain-containing protein, partial [Anaerolineae bacterium]|nr:PD40 domain-containing protein [Anaerolineae bacterium]